MKMKILLLLCKSSAYGLLHVSRDKRRGLPTALTIGGGCSEMEQLKHADFVGCYSHRSAPLRSQLGEQKNSPPPLVVLIAKTKKSKKIFAHWVPCLCLQAVAKNELHFVPFAFRLTSLAQTLPTSNIFALAFLFFSFLFAHCDKKISPLLLKFFHHTSHALFVMRKNTLKHQNKNQGIGGTPKN